MKYLKSSYFINLPYNKQCRIKKTTLSYITIQVLRKMHANLVVIFEHPFRGYKIGGNNNMAQQQQQQQPQQQQLATACRTATTERQRQEDNSKSQS